MTTETAKTLTTGGWSHGTLRDEDLAETVLDMARSVGISADDGIVISGGTDFDYLARYLRHVEEHDSYESCDGETSGEHFRECPIEYIRETIETAIDALHEYAPIYCYIGMVEGDGPSLGVWLSDDALQEAIANGERVDSETVINRNDGVRIHISDHGNVSVYALSDDRELLAIV